MAEQSDETDNNSVAVVWYDGNQKCKVLNVMPLGLKNNGDVTPTSSACPLHGNNDYVGYIHVHGNKTLQRNIGVDNVAFDKNTDLDEDDVPRSSSYEMTPSCSWHRASRRDSANGGTSRRSSESNCSTADPSNSDAANAHTNSSFDVENQVNDSDVNSVPALSCSCLPTLHSFTDEDIRQVTPTELENEVGNGVNADVGDNSSSKIHVIKRNVCGPNSLDSVVVCNVCQNEIPITTNNQTTKVESEEPPPNYSSLRYMFLADEPPKYQDVTGKALTSASIPVRHRIFSESTKRRIVIACVVIFFLLIGALLVYACFVSGSPLGTYGAAPRKF